MLDSGKQSCRDCKRLASAVREIGATDTKLQVLCCALPQMWKVSFDCPSWQRLKGSTSLASSLAIDYADDVNSQGWWRGKFAATRLGP